MTPNEYRKQHKKCGFCKYWKGSISYGGYCKVKIKNKRVTDGRFCKVFQMKEFEE